MKLAFLDLPDDRVDLISLARRTEGVEIVLVAHANPDSLALRMAEVLQIPRSTEPLDLLPLKPDRVALPSLETPSAEALAREGVGLAYVPDDSIEDDLAEGRLERVLESFLTKGPGLCLYFPARMQEQPKLRALIEMVASLRQDGSFS